MTKEQLQDRIQKSEVKIEKIEKRIKKWQDAQTEEACLKHYDYMLSWGKTVDAILSQCYDEYIKNCNWELDHAVQDLHDAQLTLEKYQNLLALEVAKDNEFENNRIMVIWNFLLNYKEQVAEFIRNNIKVLNEYYEVNSKMCDWHNNNSYKVYNGEMTREEYNRVYNELREQEKELESNIHPYTKLVATRNYPEKERKVDEAKLEEILLKDCKARYFQLVNEVTEITGIITDATNLAIHGGELNGIIIGEKGKAKVLTFEAGIYHIVQCPHYRTRISKIE